MRLAFWKRTPKPPEGFATIESLTVDKQGKLDLTVKSRPMIEYLGSIMRAFWEDNGSPPNYVSMRLWHPQLGEMEATVRKCSGELPATRAARIEAEAYELKAALEWINDNTTLHRQVEILYVVDGYEVEVTYDGNPHAGPWHGETLLEALKLAREAGAKPEDGKR